MHREARGVSRGKIIFDRSCFMLKTEGEELEKGERARGSKKERDRGTRGQR